MSDFCERCTKEIFGDSYDYERGYTEALKAARETILNIRDVLLDEDEDSLFDLDATLDAISVRILALTPDSATRHQHEIELLEARIDEQRYHYLTETSREFRIIGLKREIQKLKESKT